MRVTVQLPRHKPGRPRCREKQAGGPGEADAVQLRVAAALWPRSPAFFRGRTWRGRGVGSVRVGANF